MIAARFLIQLISTAIFLSLFTPSVGAQNPIQYSRHYGVEEGLPSSEVHDVLQDTKGYMWFATDRGLARFDGYNFRTFSNKDGLTDNSLLKLYEDSKNKIWMYTLSGKLFHTDGDTVISYTFNDTLNKYCSNYRVSSFLIDEFDNVLGAIDFLGDYKIDPGGNFIWNKFIGDKLIDQKQFLVHEFKSGKVLFASGFELFPGNLLLIDQKIEKTERLTLNIDNRGRFNAANLSQDSIILSIHKKLYLLQSSTLKYLNEYLEPIVFLDKDDKQNLYVGTESGCYVYKKEDLKNYTSYYLEGKYITGVQVDSEGGTWFTTVENGVYYFPRFGVINMQFEERKFQKPISIASDFNSSIYLGFWFGDILKITNLKKTQMISASSTFDIYPVNKLTYFKDDEKLYISSNHFNGYVYNEKFHLFKNKEQLYVKTTYLKRKNGDLYATSGRDIYKFQHDSLKILGQFSSRLNCLVELEDGRLLFGSNHGAFIYNEEKNVRVLFHKELDNIRVDDIKKMKNVLCFATKGVGILFLMNNRIYKINESDGLCSDLTNKLLVDGNTLWCISNKGVSKIEFSDIDQFKFHITNIKTDDGLLNNEITDIAMLKDNIYLTMNPGISVLNKNMDFISHFGPRIHITNLRVNNKNTIIHDGLQFPYSENNISLEFIGIAYHSNRKITYKYHLIEGKDTIVSSSTAGKAEFFSLNPGNYVFTVTAVNNSGVSSENPQSIHFEITAPWWKTIWFNLILFSAISVAIYSIYKFRIRLIKKEFDSERIQASLHLTALRSQMNPHFIFNVMDSIRNYMMERDLESAEKYLTAFAKLVRYTLDHSDKQVSTLEAELKMLGLYIELENERFSNKIEVNIHCDEDLDTSEILIPTMILQPFIENVFKHGLSNKTVKGKMQINIFKVTDSIKIIIEDNGTGRKKVGSDFNSGLSEKSSKGSTIVQARIKAYNRAYSKTLDFDIEDLYDSQGLNAGTRVTLMF